jgi:hypothetical protein
MGDDAAVLDAVLRREWSPGTFECVLLSLLLSAGTIEALSTTSQAQNRI